MSTTTQQASTTAGSQVPMTRMNFSIIATIMLATLVTGVAVGFATSNLYFSFVMFGFPLVAFFAVGVFDDRIGSTTRPAGGPKGAGLPLAALVVSCVGLSVVGIALAHVSRHLIRRRGGEGEGMSFVALIVGYSVFTVQCAVALWVATFLLQSA